MNIAPYKALALQTKCYAVNKLNALEAKESMMKSIATINKQIAASKAFIGQDLHLVVLPEYFLTGFPMGESISEWQAKACISVGDTVYAALQQMAVDNKIYLSGNVYENDEHFSKLYFQTSFIIAPSGEVILRYRRLNSMYAPTPHDVLDKYIEHYGAESLFPIVDTAIGKLACIASEEILYPEIARCLAMNGAEVLLHSSSEVGSNLHTQKNVAKMARAVENMMYVISANSAGIYNCDIPANSTDAHSQIINYEGLKIVEAGYGESMVANTTIHIEQLRAHRQRPGMSNYLARQRNELFAPYYNKTMYAANSISDSVERSHFATAQKNTIAQLIEKGIITQ